MVAKVTFNGPNVNIESIDVRLIAGHIVANGNINTKTQLFDFQGKAENIQLARLTALANRPGFPRSQVSPIQRACSGNLSDQDCLRIRLRLMAKDAM